MDSDPSDLFSDPFLIEVPTHNKNRWAVGWSDLMMTMFVLFAVLYIYQTGHREFELRPGKAQTRMVEHRDGPGESPDQEPLPSQVLDDTRKAIQEDFVSNFTSVEFVKDKAIRISIASDLLFDVGKADLKPMAKKRLRRIAAILNQNHLAIIVAGHTDITPIHSAQYPTNWELSADRACKVARFMIESGNVDAGRFTLTAHSFHRPVARNDTMANRAENRRVEIILMKNRSGPGKGIL